MPIPEYLKPILKLSIPVILIGGLAGILGAVSSGTYLIRYSSSLQQNDLATQQLSGVKPRPLPGSVEEALANVRRSAVPSTVVFYANQSGALLIPETQVQGVQVGVGAVVTSDGWVITTQDVVGDSVGLVWGRINDKTYEVDTTYYDQLTKLSIAHLKDAGGLAVVPFGDSQAVESGEAVYVVAGPEAIIPTAVVNPRQLIVVMPTVQPAEAFTSNVALADQSPVASSLVVNSSGELVALTLVAAEGAEAVPMHHLLSAVKSLIRSNDLLRASFGASVSDLARGQLAESLTSGLTRGAFVHTVNLYGPASTAGLQKGDIITRFGDTELNEKVSLADAIAAYQAGDKVSFTVNRAGAEVQLEVELGR